MRCFLQSVALKRELETESRQLHGCALVCWKYAEDVGMWCGEELGVEGGRKFTMEVWHVLAVIFFRLSGIGARLGAKVGREGGG